MSWYNDRQETVHQLPGCAARRSAAVHIDQERALQLLAEDATACSHCYR